MINILLSGVGKYRCLESVRFFCFFIDLVLIILIFCKISSLFWDSDDRKCSDIAPFELVFALLVFL